MPKCEMCGKEDRLRRAKVEGTELNVCGNCTKYGEVVKSNNYYSSKDSKNQNFRRKTVKIEGPEYELVPDYNKIILKIRQDKDMKQEDFANSINERLSVLQKWENGTLKMRIGTARQLERMFHVKLLKLVKNNTSENKNEDSDDKDNELRKFTSNKKSSDGLTLGDFIKVRKKK
ncbi:TIGR00270 family protein [archaeon]|jgi:putative transcription factor|nr:TIGR00270 family protein [archaeon]MBT3450615.1 TIGR00270 family protein [archaeon]MBT6868699.1 TIGR00270 family protein [archaeon]MBT7193487.1 TIGR00270 family protein [archaeon]MBT7381078.1 TIGR00270 family protein [archaeon]